VRVLVAMSGGVDSSVAAALLSDAGHDVVGCTLQLWGGPTDAGCCSAADVDDARRVAQVLGIDHHVFNLAEAFNDEVVTPYVDAHADGRTPNPCVACNRSIKFGALLGRAGRLGFDALATGHHARVVHASRGPELRRGRDRAKDQSYVLGFLDAATLARLHLPVGEMTKDEVRSVAASLGLRTARKPDSQDVCFVPREGRRGFLAARAPLTPGVVVERSSGAVLARVDAVELVTLGQRRGLGPSPDGRARYAVGVDVANATVYVGSAADAMVRGYDLEPASLTWTGAPVATPSTVLAQASAHGTAVPATLTGDARPRLDLDAPARPVAPGQLCVLYDPSDPDRVLGAATVARAAT
jgi:tRNA-specific 2-thiouridylase